MSPIFLRAFVGVLVVGLWSATSNAATFELARRADGVIVHGVKIEGDIVPGDAKRLLDFYKTYGVMTSPVHLRSKGGNVGEAMKMGEIIRRLRLETEIPVWDTGKPPSDYIKVDNQENLICASACFLVYAGGANRFGNYLAMHRPFLPREDARKLSDMEYETAQKEIVPKVKAYLVDMEIDQYWIDRMFSANSQEYYMPSWNEADSKIHHLMGVVASLEEVILSKCNEDPDVDRKIKAFFQNSGKTLSADDQVKLKQVMLDSDVFFQCKESVISDMQRAAFDRENDDILKEKCKQFPQLTPSEFSSLKALAEKGSSATADEVKLKMQLFYKNAPYNQCRNDEGYALSFATLKNWSDEFDKSKRVAHPVPADDFDAKGLSAEAMAKKGKDAYEAESYDVALRWFRKAADLGNADAMMGMSWIFGNGRGVPKDEPTALRWRKMSAEHGNPVAMTVIAYGYEQGEGVTQDYAEAMRWYRKAADRDDASAKWSIGQLFENGKGVAQDYAEAMRWYRRAANGGYTFAMWSIGILYEYGRGVPKDEAQAREWMKKAAATGNIPANMWLKDHP